MIAPAPVVLAVVDGWLFWHGQYMPGVWVLVLLAYWVGAERAWELFTGFFPSFRRR